MRDGSDIPNRLAFATEHGKRFRANGDFDVGIVAIRPHHGNVILIDDGEAANQHRAKHGEHGDGHADAKHEND
jgi:hypothetical protein